MKKLLVDIWNCLFDCYLTVRNSLYLFMDIPSLVSTKNFLVTSRLKIK